MGRVFEKEKEEEQKKEKEGEQKDTKDKSPKEKGSAIRNFTQLGSTLISEHQAHMSGEANTTEQQHGAGAARAAKVSSPNVCSRDEGSSTLIKHI